MLFRKLWRGLLILGHFLLGIGQLLKAGGFQQPFDPQVRDTVRRWYHRMLRILGVEVEVIGTLPHERDGAVIMIANHISWIDIPLIGSLTPVNFLSKAEVASWPLIGPVAARIGTLFIARGSGDTERVMQDMARHLQRNLSVLFFPEGTTTEGNKVRRFHKKLFKVAEVQPVTVCPLFIRYEVDGDINPVPFVGNVSFGSHLWRLLGHGRIRATVEVLPPVALEPGLIGQQVRGIELAMRDKLQLRQPGSVGEADLRPVAQASHDGVQRAVEE